MTIEEPRSEIEADMLRLKEFILTHRCPEAIGYLSCTAAAARRILGDDIESPLSSKQIEKWYAER